MFRAQGTWSTTSNSPSARAWSLVASLGSQVVTRFQAFLMGDDDFINWKTNHEARAYWQTGKVAAATIDARFSGPGTFHLVISNVFSLSTSKTVAVQGQVECP